MNSSAKNLRIPFDPERLIYYALVVSLSMHATLLVLMFLTKAKETRVIRLRQVEVSYKPLIKVRPQKKQTQAYPVEQLKEQPGLVPMKEEAPSKEGFPVDLVKEKARLEETFKMHERSLEKNKALSMSRKVLVPALQSEKINNPYYLNYYQMVRDRIRERAYLNYAQLDAGEVYLTFVLLASGEIKAIKIMEDKTSANDYLRTTALRSIQEASPFPSFPKDLKYPELTFNVVISFQVNP